MKKDPTTDDRCGTYAGAMAHMYRNERKCQACRDAASSYQRERRATIPTVRATDRRYSRARARALTQLAAMHPVDYHRLWVTELQRLPRAVNGDEAV